MIRVVDYEHEYRKAVSERFGIERLPTVDLLDLFPDFSVTVNNYSFLAGTSLPTDIALLKLFGSSFDGCRYLEIGSWRGESIANVAEVAADCLSITLSADEMRALGISDEFIDAHGTFSKNLANVRTIEHNSLSFDFSTLSERFDLVFVDGDHSYAGVKSDTENVLPLLKDDRSIIVWHDYGFTPDSVRYEVLAAILAGLPEAQHANLYHVSNTLCAVLMHGMTKPTALIGLHPPPSNAFSLSLSARSLSEAPPT